MVHFLWLSFRPAALALALLSLAPSTPLAAQLASSQATQGARSIRAVRFHFTADGPVRGGFALAAGRLLFGTETGSFYALDAQTGRTLWRRSIGSPVLSTPTVLGTRAYFTTWDNALHAVDVASGREQWRRDLGRTLGASDYWEYYVSSPVLADGLLHVGSGDGHVYALEPRSGKIVRSVNIGARIRSTPMIGKSVILVGTMAGTVVALDRHSGKRLWTFATVGAAQDFSLKSNDSRSVVTQPVIANDIVIAGGRDGNIYGIDLASGRERWRSTHDGDSWILGLAADDRRFYSAGGSAAIMQAADPATGKELWRTPTANAMFGGIARAGDVLVSNGILGSLFAFDTGSGATLWRFQLPDLSFASPLVAPNVVFTGSDDGSVFALDTSNASAPQLDRFVYSFTNAPAASFFWFKPEIVANINAAFANSGYQRLGSADLAAALGGGATDHGRKLIVLADTRLPENVNAAALRSYLDRGGVLVLIGPNPAGLRFDKDGALAGDDNDAVAAALGISAPDLERDNGYNVSLFTPGARDLGLTGAFVANRWARPDQVSTIFGADRSGMATAWAKSYANGGLLITLPVPRNRVADLSRYVDAIDLAVSRAARER